MAAPRTATRRRRGILSMAVMHHGGLGGSSPAKTARGAAISGGKLGSSGTGSSSSNLSSGNLSSGSVA